LQSWTGLFTPPTIRLTPNTNSSIRLYNAPRIVMADVNQDSDGDGTFGKSLYSFDIGGGVYPYNPGNSTDYPTGGNPTSGIGGKGPINVTLRFSEPMNEDFLKDSAVNLLHINSDGSEGTRINIPGSWSNATFPGATWKSGIFNIPDSFPDGKTKIAVRARRISAFGLDTYYQDLDLIGSGGPTLNTEDRSVGFKEIYLVAVVGDGLYAVSHGRIVNYMKFGITGISTRAHDALLAKWNTAPYARGVALCQPLARLASAPLARSRAVVARPARGESNLLCGVRQPAASRSAIAARTPWNTASYGDRRIAARAGTNAPAQGLPQAVLRYTASFARVAVAGRTSGGQLPRSPAGDFFFCRPAEKIQKRVFAVLSAKAIKRFFPGATAKDVGGKYYV